MPNLLLANLIAVFHGLVLIPLVVVAPLIIWFSDKRYKWLEILFALAAGSSILSIAILDYCLLSYWEYYFRAKTDPTATYQTGFVVDYMNRIGIYWTDELTIFLGGFFIAFGTIAIIKNELKTNKKDLLKK